MNPGCMKPPLAGAIAPDGYLERGRNASRRVSRLGLARSRVKGVTAGTGFPPSSSPFVRVTPGRVRLSSRGFHVRFNNRLGRGGGGIHAIRRARMFWRSIGFLSAGILASAAALAQITPAEGYTPPNDDPSVKVGGTLFLDYTFQDAPEVTDASGNQVHSNAFNLGRSYINVTGQLHHLVAFRITPDIAREGGAGSTLNGSY